MFIQVYGHDSHLELNCISICHSQVLFALNETYSATEKKVPQVIEKFALKPHNYANRLNHILSSPGQDHALAASLKQLQPLIYETIQLAHVYYTPKYAMD